MNTLTPKQKEALDFIKGYIASKGYGPSYDEIRIGLGFSSRTKRASPCAQPRQARSHRKARWPCPLLFISKREGRVMAETKFTPGPWAIEENLGTDERYCDWHSIGPVELPGGKADANSRLIAAAPELYEALEKCVEELESTVRSEFEGVWSEANFKEILKPYRDTLAKARGEAV